MYQNIKILKRGLFHPDSQKENPRLRLWITFSKYRNSHPTHALQYVDKGARAEIISFLMFSHLRETRGGEGRGGAHTFAPNVKLFLSPQYAKHITVRRLIKQHASVKPCPLTAVATRMGRSPPLKTRRASSRSRWERSPWMLVAG